MDRYTHFSVASETFTTVRPLPLALLPPLPHTQAETTAFARYAMNAPPAMIILGVKRCISLTTAGALVVGATSRERMRVRRGVDTASVVLVLTTLREVFH